ERVVIDGCAAVSLEPSQVIGVVMRDAQRLQFTRCAIEGVESGIWIIGDKGSALTLADNAIRLQQRDVTGPSFGILSQSLGSLLRIENNLIIGVSSGIIVNDVLQGVPQSITQRVEIVGNAI